MEPRELRRERRREQVREEILAATRAVILEHGLPGLTLAAVAKKVQLTKAALYHYYPSKEALYFELMYECLEGHAKAVAEAVGATTTGADALEALIRSATAYYETRKDELRLSYLVPQLGSAGGPLFKPEMLTRIRPFNDLMYGAVAEKIKADQRAGRIPRGVDGRRLAFLAHLAVIGMLTVQGLVEVADDKPLIHSNRAMVDDLVLTFLARLGAA